MKIYISAIVSILVLSFLNVATASSESQESVDYSSIGKAKPFGDAQAGKKKASTCTACHGRNGNSNVAGYPKLAGQGAKYLYKQMQDFKSGDRKDAIMASQVSGRSDKDLKDIAAYFSEQETSLGMVKKEFVEYILFKSS